jgi:hypothetical protein
MTRQERQVIATLKRARKLISKPERWTKGHSARDANGNKIYAVHSPDAVSFCVVGAIDRSQPRGAYDFAATAAFRYRMDSVAAWNDRTSTTHEMVLARFDRTIARLEAK